MKHVSIKITGFFLSAAVFLVSGKIALASVDNYVRTPTGQEISNPVRFQGELSGADADAWFTVRLRDDTGNPATPQLGCEFFSEFLDLTVSFPEGTYGGPGIEPVELEAWSDDQCTMLINNTYADTIDEFLIITEESGGGTLWDNGKTEELGSSLLEEAFQKIFMVLIAVLVFIAGMLGLGFGIKKIKNYVTGRNL